MNHSGPDKTVPILAGGAFLGILSALPLLNMVNCACCLWVIMGGALASFLYVRNYPPGVPPATYGDGALLGVLAGIVGAVIDTLISIPVNLVAGSLMTGPWQAQLEEALSDPEIPEEVRTLVESMLAGGLGVTAIIVALLMSLVIFAIFGAIGGLLGMAIFNKPGPPAGYPPQGYGSPGAQPPPYVPPQPPPPGGPGGAEG